MTISFWGYLPTAGTTSSLVEHPAAAIRVAAGQRHGSAAAGRSWCAATLQHLRELAVAQEAAGAHALLVPIGPSCEDPWVVASALVPLTTRVRFLLAFRPTLTRPVAFAQQVASFQRLSGGRLLLNVTPGVPGPPSTRYGDHLSRSERLASTAEFLEVLRGVWSGEPFDFDGTYHRVEAGSVGTPEPLPTIYYGGSSDESMAFAARHADVYLSYVEPLEMVRERFARVRQLAEQAGREVRFSLSFHAIARPTAEEAWAVADAMLEGVDAALLERSREIFAASGTNASVARQRLLGRLDTFDREAAVIAPNLWLGPMMVRSGASPAVVGSYAEVAARIAELVDAGCTDFGILRGVKDARHVAAGVLPLLADRGLVQSVTPA